MKYYPTNFITKLIFISISALGLIIFLYSGNYQTLVAVPLAIIPFLTVEGMYFSEKKDLLFHYKNIIWEDRKIIKKTPIEKDVHNIIFIKRYITVRDGKLGLYGGVNRGDELDDYKKIERDCQIHIEYKNNRREMIFQFPSNKDDLCLKIAQYLSNELNSGLLEIEEVDNSLEYIDKTYDNEKGIDNYNKFDQLNPKE